MLQHKIHIWTADEAKRILQERLSLAKQDRAIHEKQWRANEYTVFNKSGMSMDDMAGLQFDNSTAVAQAIHTVADGVLPTMEYSSSDDEVSDSLYDGTLGINYAFRNLRYQLGQLAANPSSIIISPMSFDREDQLAADLANKVKEFGRHEYKFDIVSNRRNLYVLLYGTGIKKSFWDTTAGRIIKNSKGQIVPEGAFAHKVVNIWDFYPDPNASYPEEVKWVFEKVRFSAEEVKSLWPDHASLVQAETSSSGDNSSAFANTSYQVLEAYEYWEKGLPENGYLGRWGICLEDGTLLEGITTSPEKYRPIKKLKTEKDGVAVAVLPYIIFTANDVPNQLWGKSDVENVIGLQDNMNRLDNSTLDNLRAHNASRIIVFDDGAATRPSGDGPGTSPLEVIRVTGQNTREPKFMGPMPSPAIVPLLLQRYEKGINDSYGINDSMLGEQKRETSGFSMQYSVNQANVQKYPFFTKYRDVIIEEYWSFLRICIHHWDMGTLIKVAGKEKTAQVMYVLGTDLDGGYDLVGEYGSEFSLDPKTRRDEILGLLPLFEKAGVDLSGLLKHLRLQSIGDIYDNLTLAENRQMEIFDEMVSKNIYISPLEGQNHRAMLLAAARYEMTAEYSLLDGKKFQFLLGPKKSLIRRHIKERTALAAQEQEGATAMSAVASSPSSESKAPGSEVPMGGELQSLLSMPAAGGISQ